MMRMRETLLVLLAITSASLAQSTAPTTLPARVKMSLHEGWRFWPEDRQDAENPGQDDSQWQTVDVPHTWNASDPFDDEPGYRRGQSSRTFRVDAKEGKGLQIKFEQIAGRPIISALRVRRIN